MATSRTLDHYKRELMTFGYTVVPPALADGGGLCGRLRAAVQRLAEAESEPIDLTGAAEHRGGDNPMGQQLFYLLGETDRAFVDAVTAPAIVELVRFLIQDPVISSVTASVKGPGNAALDLHADQPIHPTPRSLVCSCAYLLTPASRELGGLCFVPYSHHRMRQPLAGEARLDGASGLVSIEAPAGSLVIWHGNTWHGAHARTSLGVRIQLVVHWCSRWLRPQEAYRELLPDAIVAQGGDLLAELIGRSVHYGWSRSGPQRAPGAAFATARSRPNANTIRFGKTPPAASRSGPLMTRAELRPGDVILSAGDDSGDSEGALLDRIIIALDQGSYTHASLWDGRYVIEALTTGVSITDSLDLTLNTQTLVDVYRFDLDGQGFAPPDWPSGPVLDAARSFQGYGYGYSKLVLAGIVLLISEVPSSALVRAIVRIFSTEALAEVERWFSQEYSMICSEVVGQAFWDAVSQPANKYGLPVIIDGHRRFPDLGRHRAALAAVTADSASSPELVAFHQIRAHLAGLYMNHPRLSLAARTAAATPIPESSAKAGPKPGATFIAGSPRLPAAFVTPGDLQRSPGLVKVGSLKQPA